VDGSLVAGQAKPEPGSKKYREFNLLRSRVRLRLSGDPLARPGKSALGGINEAVHTRPAARVHVKTRLGYPARLPRKLRFGVVRVLGQNRASPMLTHSVKINPRICVILLQTEEIESNFTKPANGGAVKSRLRERCLDNYLCCFYKTNPIFYLILSDASG
jgi:hypothetical protein